MSEEDADGIGTFLASVRAAVPRSIPAVGGLGGGATDGIERVESLSRRVRVAAIAASVVGYVAVFFPLYRLIGPVAWIVTYAPVVAAATLVGLRGGIGVVAVEAAVNPRLAVATGSPPDEALLRNVIRIGSLLIVAATIGWYRDLNAKLKREIEERRAVERRLRAAREELAVLNRVLRHDIRNDVAVTLGWTRELRDHVDDEGEEMLDRVRDNGRHVVELTRSVRGLMEALDPDGGPTLRPTSVSAILREEIETREATYEGATFAVEGDLPDATVRANDLLGSVFRNLLNNAVQHSDADEPRVEITAEEREDAVAVRVADNGPGIPDDRKEAVLGRGERGPDDPAAGVGLYLVDTLVDQYGGDVRIEDNDPEGAVFEVTLPKAEE